MADTTSWRNPSNYRCNNPPNRQNNKKKNRDDMKRNLTLNKSSYESNNSLYHSNFRSDHNESRRRHYSSKKNTHPHNGNSESSRKRLRPEDDRFIHFDRPFHHRERFKYHEGNNKFGKSHNDQRNNQRDQSFDRKHVYKDDGKPYFKCELISTYKQHRFEPERHKRLPQSRCADGESSHDHHLSDVTHVSENFCKGPSLPSPRKMMPSFHNGFGNSCQNSYRESSVGKSLNRSINRNVMREFQSSAVVSPRNYPFRQNEQIERSSNKSSLDKCKFEDNNTVLPSESLVGSSDEEDGEIVENGANCGFTQQKFSSSSTTTYTDKSLFFNFKPKNISHKDVSLHPANDFRGAYANMIPKSPKSNGSNFCTEKNDHTRPNNKCFGLYADMIPKSPKNNLHQNSRHLLENRISVKEKTPCIASDGEKKQFQGNFAESSFSKSHCFSSEQLDESRGAKLDIKELHPERKKTHSTKVQDIHLPEPDSDAKRELKSDVRIVEDTGNAKTLSTKKINESLFSSDEDDTDDEVTGENNFIRYDKHYRQSTLQKNPTELEVSADKKKINSDVINEDNVDRKRMKNSTSNHMAWNSKNQDGMKLSNCDDRFKMDTKLETSLTDKKINVTVAKTESDDELRKSYPFDFKVNKTKVNRKSKSIGPKICSSEDRNESIADDFIKRKNTDQRSILTKSNSTSADVKTGKEKVESKFYVATSTGLKPNTKLNLNLSTAVSVDDHDPKLKIVKSGKKCHLSKVKQRSNEIAVTMSKPQTPVASSLIKVQVKKNQRKELKFCGKNNNKNVNVMKSIEIDSYREKALNGNKSRNIFENRNQAAGYLSIEDDVQKRKEIAISSSSSLTGLSNKKRNVDRCGDQDKLNRENERGKLRIRISIPKHKVEKSKHCFKKSIKKNESVQNTTPRAFVLPQTSDNNVPVPFLIPQTDSSHSPFSLISSEQAYATKPNSSTNLISQHRDSDDKGNFRSLLSEPQMHTDSNLTSCQNIGIISKQTKDKKQRVMSQMDCEDDEKNNQDSSYIPDYSVSLSSSSSNSSSASFSKSEDEHNNNTKDDCLDRMLKKQSKSDFCKNQLKQELKESKNAVIKKDSTQRDPLAKMNETYEGDEKNSLIDMERRIDSSKRVDIIPKQIITQNLLYKKTSCVQNLHAEAQNEKARFKRIQKLSEITNAKMNSKKDQVFPSSNVLKITQSIHIDKKKQLDGRRKEKSCKRLKKLHDKNKGKMKCVQKGILSSRQPNCSNNSTFKCQSSYQAKEKESRSLRGTFSRPTLRPPCPVNVPRFLLPQEEKKPIKNSSETKRKAKKNISDDEDEKNFSKMLEEDIFSDDSEDDESEDEVNPHWVRRSVRQPCKSELNNPNIKMLLMKLRNNDCDMQVLKLKKYMGPDTPQIVMNAVLDALSENTNCQALYIQNFNEGMHDAQLLRLLEVLKKCKNIWCLNIGETYNVKTRTWEKFVKGLKKTFVTHMYASEHTISSELKIKMRERIRKNRDKHDRHIDPNNLEVIIQCTHCWWNPINSKVLRPYLKEVGKEHIIYDGNFQGLQGFTSSSKTHST